MSFKKNTAAKLFFCLVDATDGSAMTGASVTAKRSIDGGAQADTTGSVSEVGLGQYVLAGAAGDFNGAEIGFLFTASGAVPVSITVHTDTKVVSDLHDATDVSSNVTAIKAKTDNLPASPAAVGSQMTLADGAVTAAKIAASALDNKGNWNVGKTGYSLTATTGLGNQTANITGNLSGSVGSIATDGLSAASVKADAVTKIQSGLSTLNAAGVRSAVGMSSANLDTQLSGIPAAVWTAGTRTLTSFGSLVSDIWGYATRTLTAFSDSSGVTTLLSRIVGTLASGTHSAQSGDAYARLGAPAGASVSADVAALKSETASILADTNELQTNQGNWATADVQSALTAQGYTTARAPLLDHLDADVSSVGGASVSDIVDGVWDEALAGHTTAGSAGAALATAGNAGDPWSTALPGSYSNGQAGYIIGNRMPYIAQQVAWLSPGVTPILQSSTMPGGDRILWIGADQTTDDTAWIWTDTDDAWPDWTNLTFDLYVRGPGINQHFAVSKIVGGPHKVLRVEPAKGATRLFKQGAYDYAVWMTNASDETQPLIEGAMTALNYPRA
ncbi:MAG: hypothetical protein IT209_00850 [Armatimonadetes bacterium]|nr:hypothetical protein [Armatimonadota bacterium]